MKTSILLFLLLCLSCRVTKIQIRADTSLEYTIERKVRKNGKVEIDTISKNINYKKFEMDSTNKDKYPPCFYNNYEPKMKKD